MIAIKPASGIAGNSDAAKEEESKAPSTRTLRGLDCLNFFLADVQTGVGPLLAIYLAAYGWNEPRVGFVLTVGGIAHSGHLCHFVAPIQRVFLP